MRGRKAPRLRTECNGHLVAAGFTPAFPLDLSHTCRGQIFYCITQVLALQFKLTMFAGNQISPLMSRSTQQYFAVGAWLLVILMFLSLASQWVTLTSSDRQFTEYVQGLIQRAAEERRSQKDVRTLILLKAEELSVPIQSDGINLTSEGGQLQTTLNYVTEIKIPL